MSPKEITLRRGHIVAVLLANAILWVAAVLATGYPLLGGLAVVGLISIASLLFARPGLP